MRQNVVQFVSINHLQSSRIFVSRQRAMAAPIIHYKSVLTTSLKVKCVRPWATYTSVFWRHDIQHNDTQNIGLLCHSMTTLLSVTFNFCYRQCDTWHLKHSALCWVSHFIYHTLLSIRCIFCIENDAEIFPAHYTWKVAEKGFIMAFTMNKLAMNDSYEIIVER